MPRKSKTDELREKFEVAIAKSLESNSAAERTQALRSAGDLLNPNLTDLQKQLKQAEDAREAAETSLNKITVERDQAQGVLCLALQSALQLTATKAELVTLKAGNDKWQAEQMKLIVAEAQQCKWDALKAERAAKETLQDAERQFGARGQQILLNFVQKLVEQFNIPEPAPETLPAGISPLVFILWGHSPIKAQLMLAYSKSFPEPNEAFKNTLRTVLRARLPRYEGTPKSDPIPDIDVKQSVLTAMAVKWDVLDEVQRLIDSEQVTRQANFLREHHAQMQAQSNDAALRGEGRTPIAVEEKSITGCPLSEHDALCVCKICSPNLRRPSSLDALDNVENF